MGINENISDSDLPELDLGESGVDLDASSSVIPDLIGDPSSSERVDSRLRGNDEEGNPPISLEGRNLDGFRIIRKLGEGGMGEVWLAHHEDLDIEVAVKVLPPHLAGDQSFLMRFMREARAVAKLDHPNIIGVKDAGRREVDGQYLRIMVMEYMSGSDAA